MTILLPIVALTLAVLVFALFRDASLPNSERPHNATFGVVALIIALAAYAAFRLADPADRAPIGYGLLTGALLTSVAACLPDRRANGPGFIALGTAGPALLLYLPAATTRPAMAAMMAGVGFVSLCFVRQRPAALTGFIAIAVAAATILGRAGSTTTAYAHAGVVLGIGSALIGLLAHLANRSNPKWERILPLPLALLTAAMVYLIGIRYLFIISGGISMALGVGAALTIHWLLPDDETPEPLRLSLSAVISIGLGTIVFGLARGFGISLALVTAVGYLISLGNHRAILSLGPLAGLVLYRLFRQFHPEASRALDIGQHYAMIGFSLGALIPLIPSDWLEMRGKLPLARLRTAEVVWALMLSLLPPVLALMLGAKGIVGFITGLGFCTLLSGLRPTISLAILPIATGVGGLTLLSYGWLGELMDTARDDKLRWFIGCTAAVFVLASILFTLGYTRTAAETEAA